MIAYRACHPCFDRYHRSDSSIHAPLTEQLWHTVFAAQYSNIANFADSQECQ